MVEISVIIPNYNRSEFLRRAVLSAWNQSLKPLEILVCDDGSSDDSENVVRQLQSDIPVQWIACGNNGRPAIPRNIGIKLAKGNWIAFLDNDDYWHPEKLKRQILLADTESCNVICTNAVRIQNGAEQKNYFNFPSCKLSFENLIIDNKVICSSVLVKTEILNKVGGFPEEEKFKAFEDYVLWLKIASYFKIFYTQEALTYYIDNPVQSIRNSNENEFQLRNTTLLYLKEWIHSENINDDRLLLVEKQIKRELFKKNYPLLQRIFNRLKSKL
jgi:glycosyltransferase involved in cell wall biosynthesis